MSLFRKLTAKPWEDMPELEEVTLDGTARVKTMRAGLFIFIAVAGVLFSLFIVAYHMRMMMGGWHMLYEPTILWWNTAILLLASIVMQVASSHSKKGNIEQARRSFFGAGILAFGFLIGQLMAWQELIEAGCFASANPANAFYYLMTGLHGVHLAGGLVAWGRAMVRVSVTSEGGQADISASIELCDYYWHFLLLVWLVLFALFLIT